ncbi:MAG TPA: ATP-dependent protease ATPase subunit HslU [Armatimonadota bacterium]
MADLTPREIVAELDRYIVGQAAAKRAVAIALRNRTRRQRLPEEMRDEVIPKNILMIGPTGVGKTEIARRLAKLAGAPFVKVEASKFTEVGYVGRDVDSMVRDLAQTAVRMVQTERSEAVKAQTEENVVERIVDALMPQPPEEPSSGQTGTFQDLMGQILSGRPPQPPTPPPPDPTAEQRSREHESRRQQLRREVREGLRDDDRVEIEVESGQSPSSSIFSPGGMEEVVLNLPDMLGPMMGKRRKTRRMTVRDARKALAPEEAQKLIDMDDVTQEAIERTEQSGIIFLDEIDKIAGKDRGHGPDVSREGVQRDILPIIEGSTVNTRFGPIKTDHILFIAAGAFHISKPSDLIPELQGRLPIRVELESLTQDNFRQILVEPKNALTKQYSALMATEGVTLEWTEEGIAEVAHIAVEVNTQTENIGARRLHTVMERLLEDLSFEAPGMDGVTVTLDRTFVRAKLEPILKQQDLSRYVL